MRHLAYALVAALTLAAGAVAVPGLQRDRSVGGCVELKAVDARLGAYAGADPIARVCGQDVRAGVDAWTHHRDVVLSAVVPYGVDRDARIVPLTGRP